jgi:hypothetical protein
MTDFMNRAITWDVPFENGTLKAVAKNNGNPVADYEIKTTGTPERLSAFCGEKILKADNNDLAHVFVTICDDDGNIVYNADNEVTCEIDGPVRLLGMEDSNPSNIENYKDNKQHAYHGKLLIYLQSMDSTGKATIILTSPGLETCKIELTLTK